MDTLRNTVVLFLGLACLSARADSVYFGGIGETNTHWVGYRVSVATNSITWTAYTLDPAGRGRIKVAPATFHAMGTNTWTAVFDEYVLRKNGQAIGLARHDLRIISNPGGQFIEIQDGKDTLRLLRLSPEDLAALKGGRIPNPQGGANGRQPFTSDTNRESGAAASRRSP